MQNMVNARARTKNANNKVLFIEIHIFVFFFVFSRLCVEQFWSGWLRPVSHIQLHTSKVIAFICQFHIERMHGTMNEWKVQKQRNHYNFSLNLMSNCVKHNNNNNNNNATNKNVKYADEVL